MPADCSWCWYRCWCRCQTSRWCLGADTMQRNEQQKLHLQQQTLAGSPHTHKHTHAQTIVNMLRPRSMNCGALLIRCVGQILGQRTHTGRQAKERQRAERESNNGNSHAIPPMYTKYNKSDKQITRHKAAQSTSMLQVVFTIC